MSQQSQKFCTSHAKNSTWATGLRTFFEYRDLGIGDATHGQFNAHVIRVKKPVEQFPHTGPHIHELDFQMFFVLKGWIKFVYKDHGEHLFEAGDSCLQPPGIVPVSYTHLTLPTTPYV